MTKSIMIVGVGGQGTLVASKVLANTFINQGYDVKVSEVHGMSQRGGSVIAYVKYGDKVYSPIVDKGEADMILAFELLEGYRALPYLKKDGKLIVSTQKINPMPVITGIAKYPENIVEKLSDKVKVLPIAALPLAKETGNIKSVNMVLIGFAAKTTDIPYESWISSIKKTVSEKYWDIDIKAFDLGYNI